MTTPEPSRLTDLHDACPDSTGGTPRGVREEDLDRWADLLESVAYAHPHPDRYRELLTAAEEMRDGPYRGQEAVEPAVADNTTVDRLRRAHATSPLMRRAREDDTP